MMALPPKDMARYPNLEVQQNWDMKVMRVHLRGFPTSPSFPYRENHRIVEFSGAGKT